MTRSLNSLSSLLYCVIIVIVFISFHSFHYQATTTFKDGRRYPIDASPRASWFGFKRRLF